MDSFPEDARLVTNCSAEDIVVNPAQENDRQRGQELAGKARLVEK
jgi:hypothetical protein